MITQEQKTIKNKLGIILIGVLSLFACSQKIEKLPTRPLNGQIFVVTQGRANITLGGVTIAAIPVEDTLGKQISRWNLLNDDLNNYQEKHTNLNCAHNYFGFILDYIPSYNGILRTTSDADGKFAFNLDKSKTYILWATASRKFYDNEEFYEWTVAVDTTFSQLMLTNSNMYSF